MAKFVIARNSDTRIMMKGSTRKEYYASMGRAVRALDVMVTEGELPEELGDYTCYELEHYRKDIEKYEEVKNLMSGKMVKQSVNTPLSCDVSSETYWSM